MPGLSGSMQVLDPQPGIIPGPPVLGARSLSHWTTREVPDDSYFIDEDKGSETRAVDCDKEEASGKNTPVFLLCSVTTATLHF